MYGTLGGVRSKNEIVAWINDHYPNRWKSGTFVGHLYGCSVNNPKGAQHHPGFPRFLFTHGDNRYEMYDPQKHGHYENGYPAGEQPELAPAAAAAEQAAAEASATFAYETHLRDYLARHLEILEPGLRLWTGDIDGSVEFPVDGRRIDILAKDKDGQPVVIELKVSRGHERTVGQCLFYRGKIREMFNAPTVRIFIVAEDVSPELRVASKEVNDVFLFEYSLSMTVRRV